MDEMIKKALDFAKSRENRSMFEKHREVIFEMLKFGSTQVTIIDYLITIDDELKEKSLASLKSGLSQFINSKRNKVLKTQNVIIKANGITLDNSQEAKKGGKRSSEPKESTEVSSSDLEKNDDENSQENKTKNIFTNLKE